MPAAYAPFFLFNPGKIMATVAYHFLGCRLNEAEIEFIARELTNSGHKMVTLQDHPDVIILNTCGVTSEAMRKSRNFARRMAALHPAILVLMGCAVDLMAAGEQPLEDQVLEDIDGEGTPEKGDIKILRILQKDRPQVAQIVSRAIADFLNPALPDRESLESAKSSYRLRMRSFIKIEDGCNNRCTYCSVRLARGRETSIPSRQVIEEIQKCIELGEKEFVLTGVQVGAWREGECRLPDLIRMILEHTDVKRLRLSSIEPWHFHPQLWQLWEDPRLCPHFHVPVQSGCDEVLTLMQRRTPIDSYLNKIEAIRHDIPGVRISTDIIVGFPGETDSMWQETLNFLERAEFDDAHLFTFSARPNTVAASLPNQLSYEQKHQRWHEADSLMARIRHQRELRFEGYSCEVLWENISKKEPHQNLWHGYSKNYLKLERWFNSTQWMRGTVTQETFGIEDIQE